MKRVWRWIVPGMAAIAMTMLACGPQPALHNVPGTRVVEGGVMFVFVHPSAKRVDLVGDFNEWNPRADPMNDKNGDGNWTLFYPLVPGVYRYKFVVDGRRWVPDPTNPDGEPDGFDGRNSIVRVPESR